MAELILNLCRYPDDCRVVESIEGHDLSITIVPHRADFRVICGKGGRQIKALKYLGKRAGEQAHPFVYVDVLLEEGEVGAPESPHPFVQDPQFDINALLERIRRAADLVFTRNIELEYERECDKLRVTIATSDEDPEEAPTVVALGDVFYPACFKAGMLCEIKVRKRPEPATAT